jgi:hypothetical protein
MIGRKIAAGLALACCALLAEAKEPFPHRLQLEVAFVEGGSEGLREELQRELAYALERARCFAREAPEEREVLLLRVAIEELIDETSFDLSIAERYSENALPEATRQLTSWLQVDFWLELHLLPDSIPLRSRFVSIRTGYRPRLDEDPREENRIQAIDEIVRTARGFACKGSPKKLRKQIDRASKASASRAASDR